MSVSGQVSEVFGAYLEIREKFYDRRNGRKPPSAPKLTPAVRDKIKAAIRIHGYEKTLAAGKGLFVSDFHTGNNDRKTLYLSPSVAWRMPNASGNGPDNVEKFSELYYEETEN